MSKERRTGKTETCPGCGTTLYEIEIIETGQTFLLDAQGTFHHGPGGCADGPVIENAMFKGMRKYKVGDVNVWTNPRIDFTPLIDALNEAIKSESNDDPDMEARRKMWDKMTTAETRDVAFLF